MNLNEAMQQATEELCTEKGIQPDEINEADCFNWAFKVFNLVPGTAIGGHRIDGEGQSYIIYGGLCYDSATPQGVPHWWQLTSFQTMFSL